MKILIVTLSTLAVATSLSLAQDKPAEAAAPAAPEKAAAPADHQRPSPEEIFKKIDANSDGFITLDELKAGPRGKKDPAKAEEMFKKSDTTADAKLTLDEFKAGHKHRDGKGGKGGRHKPAPAPQTTPAPQS